jgi:glutathione S-transferase
MSEFEPPVASREGTKVIVLDGQTSSLSLRKCKLTVVEGPDRGKELIVDREVVEYLESDKDWCGERMAMVDERIRGRLSQLSYRLGDGEWLDGAFSAGDLMMVLVLRRLEGSSLLKEYPNLAAYVARAVARPAYQRAFADQLAVFTEAEATG